MDIKATKKLEWMCTVERATHNVPFYKEYTVLQTWRCQKELEVLEKSNMLPKNLLHTVDQNLLPSVNHNYSMRSNKVMEFCKLIQGNVFLVIELTIPF